MRELSGKVVLITGASSGLGRELALQFGAEGASLALCGRSRDKLESLVGELGERASALGKAAIPTIIEAFDLEDRLAIGTFVERTTRGLGGLDVLVNCAGANTARAPVEGMGLDDLEYMLRLNCVAPAAFLKASHEALARSGTGLAVNILSSCCLFSNEGLAAYTASKKAFQGIVDVYRKEARRRGIRVCAVYPGGIDTPFRPQSRPDYLSASSVAEAIVSLAKLDGAVAPDELVLRPLVETNYA